jgi:hypothetical protein
MAEPAEEVEKWKTSEAKKYLEALILDGSVTAESDPNEVYNSLEEFQMYNIRNFKSNLRNLIASINLKEELARFDIEAVEHHMGLHPRPQLTQQNYPFWDTSSAKTLLVNDMNNGLELIMAPKDLRNTRPEYQAFPLDVFRRHIHQEKRRLLQSSYRLFQKDQKAKRKQKKRGE